MNDTAAILTKARDLISSPKNWTQGCPARAGDGTHVSYTSKNAKQFCAVGAIYRATHDIYIIDSSGEFFGKTSDRVTQLIRDVSKQMYNKGIVSLNDAGFSGGTREINKAAHREVLNVFDAAITQLR